jgi:hypothetical protein
LIPVARLPASGSPASEIEYVVGRLGALVARKLAEEPEEAPEPSMRARTVGWS